MPVFARKENFFDFFSSLDQLHSNLPPLRWFCPVPILPSWLSVIDSIANIWITITNDIEHDTLCHVCCLFRGCKFSPAASIAVCRQNFHKKKSLARSEHFCDDDKNEFNSRDFNCVNNVGSTVAKVIS